MSGKDMALSSDPYRFVKGQMAREKALREFIFSSADRVLPVEESAFTLEIHTRAGALYSACRSDLLAAVGHGYEKRRELQAGLPHSALRLRVYYPNGTRVDRDDLAASIRTVRVLAGELPRRHCK